FASAMPTPRARTRVASAAAARGLGLMMASSRGLEVDGLDDVSHVTGRVPARLHRLRLAALAGRAHEERLIAGRQLHVRLPGPERVLAEVLAELGRAPALAAVRGERDLLDAVAAVEGDAAHHGVARLHRGAVREVGDERAHVEALDR